MAPSDQPPFPQPEVPLGLPALPAVPWQTPKTLLSRLVRGATGIALANVARSYVQAAGGSRTVVRSAIAGRAATAGLGGFLANGVQNGFEQAAQQLGLQPYLGQDAEHVLAAFIDLLAPDGALREEAAARAALVETSIELFDRYDVAASGITALDAMDVDGMREIVALSVTNYVNERLQEELASRIERGALTEHEANLQMTDMKEFVGSVVRLDLSSVDVLTLDWGGPEGTRFVERVYETGYAALGGESV